MLASMPGAPAGRRLGARTADLAPLAVYVALSVALFGRGVVRDPRDLVVGDAGADKSIFMWALAWFPHAIARGEDPLHTTAIWAPQGTDLAWVTAIPAAALTAAPVTMTLGPVVSYNVLALAAPALAAWSAFLLARQLTRTALPSLVAGFLYGFGPFHTIHTTGHLHMTLTFAVPLCALLVVRRHVRELRRLPFVLAIAAALTIQFLCSTEIFALLLVVGAVAAAAAVWRLELERPAILALAAECAAGVALAAILLTPYLLHAFVVAGTEAQPLRSPYREAADVANLVVPTRRTWVRPPASDDVVARFTAGGAERTAYLGLPLLAIVGVAALSRARGRQMLVLALAAVVVASFGPRIRVVGVETLPGPWAAAAHLPVLAGVKPARLTVFAALLAALVASLWLADAPRNRWRWALALAAVLTLVPNPARALWTSEVPRSSYFASGRWTQHVRGDEIALVLPYGPAGWTLLWQAEAGFRPRLVGGHIGRRVTPREEPWRDAYWSLAGGPPVSRARFRAFLAAHGVAVVVIAPGTNWRARRVVTAAIDAEPVRSGDAHIYRLAGAHRRP